MSTGLRSGAPPSIRWGGGALVALSVLALLLARAPELTTGAVLGAALLAVTLRWPLPVLTVLLVMGPVDLSFITGGLKGLAPALGGLDMNGIRLVAASAGFGLLVLLDPKLRHLLVQPPALLYGVFLLWAGVSLLWSPAPLDGLRLWLKIAWPLLVFLVVAHPDRTSLHIEQMVKWVLVGAFALLLLNPVFVLSGGYEFESGGRLRITGLGIHQNPFSFYLLTMIVLALSRFLKLGLRRDLVLAGVALAWMGLTLTRITLLAGFVTLTLVGGYALWRERNVKLGLLVGGVLAVMAIGFVPLTVLRTFGEIPTWGALVELLKDPVLLYQTINLEGREVLWAVLYTAWAERPLLGLGLGASTFALQAVLPPDIGMVAHNEYMRLGTDTGWFGLALAVAAAGALALAARGAKAETPNPARNPWTLPAFSGLVIWAVVSVTDNALDYYAPFTQYVGFLVGAAVVWNRGAQLEPKKRL